jgi:hypothetical protein
MNAWKSRNNDLNIRANCEIILNLKKKKLFMNKT